MEHIISLGCFICTCICVCFEYIDLCYFVCVFYSEFEFLLQACLCIHMRFIMIKCEFVYPLKQLGYLLCICIFSDDEDLNEEDSLEFDAGFGNIIVVDNLPVVPKEKFEKLEGVVRKIYSQIGVIKESGLWMPVEEDTGKTRGYCFIEYNTPQVPLSINCLSTLWFRN